MSKLLGFHRHRQSVRTGQGRNKGQQELLGVMTQPASSLRAGVQGSLLSTVFLRSADVKCFQVLPTLTHAAAGAHSLSEMAELRAGVQAEGFKFVEVCGKAGALGRRTSGPQK